MTLRSRLRFIVFLTAVILFVGLLGIMVQNYVSYILGDFMDKAWDFVVSSQKLVSASKDMIAYDTTRRATEQLEDVFDKWKLAVSELDTDLKELYSHKGVAFLSKDLKEEIKSLEKLWTLNNANFNKTETFISDLLENIDLPDNQRRGLLQIKLNIRESYDKATIASFYINEAMGSLYSTINISEEFLSSKVLSLIEKLKTSVRKTEQIIQFLVIVLVLMTIVFSSFLVFRVNRTLTDRISSLSRIIGEIKEKKLTRGTIEKLQTMSRMAKDELGEIGEHNAIAFDMLRNFLLNVKKASMQVDVLKESLASGVRESSASSNQITKNMDVFKQVLKTLDASIEQTSAAITQIVTGTEEIERDISIQAENIEESSEAIEEINSSIRRASNLAEKERENLSEIMELLKSSGEKINNTNYIVNNISREISNVKEIIDIIDAVAEQTNLLSMNAAIESAHAGDAGRGFAVVAEEIRKLAESTEEHATKINQSLRNMLEQISTASEVSSDSAESFEHIQKSMEKFYISLEEITKLMTTLSQNSNSILENIQNINVITTRVKEESVEISNKTADIHNVSEKTKELALNVNKNIIEIENGIKEISNALTDIDRLAQESKNRMDVLRDTVEAFSLEESESE
ncbi:methyl-accepting chemotaxis protein [Spirochaetia bacterium 38H-sp]|uniref:Methyl-accepting chemotaxis protein n=1 Tax=Rarispira pelagica TaxID=3141764 RepID=A0ABU9UA10_9SPIR